MKKIKVRDMTITAMFIALGVIFPYIFHTAQISGQMFLPMHIPVLLCGIICGPFLGGICAIATVPLCSVLTGMPPIYPMGTIMIFELVAYAVSAGILFRLIKKLKINLIASLYITLIASMLIGRGVYGLVAYIVYGVIGNGYAFKAFITSAFVTGLPGIAIQLALIPWLYILLKKAKLIDVEPRKNTEPDTHKI
ncbi:MAG: ECF transporter S component [Clostridia bacterium]|nr:ECF transporter S component [Clostridia bacterium]